MKSVLLTRIFACAVLGVAVGAQAPAPGALAAPPQGLALTAALQLRQVTNPQLGQDFAAFTLVVPRAIDDGPGGAWLHLGVIDGLGRLEAGKLPTPRWLISGKDSAPAMAIRPGTREVTYLRSQQGRSQLLLQSIDGGEPRPWAATPSIAAYRWRPDGKAVAFTALDPMPAARVQAQVRGFQPVVVDEDWRHLSLWVVEEGREPRRLTEGVTVFGMEWAPDGQRLALACAPRNLVDDSYMFTRLWVLDLADGQRRPLVDNPGKLGSFTWSGDGRFVAYITAADRNDPHAGLLQLVEVATGATRPWPRLQPGMVGEVLWSGDGPLCLDHVGVRSTVRARGDQPWRYSAGPLAGFPERGQVHSFAVHQQQLAVAFSTPQHPPELYLRGFGRLTDSNPALRDVALGEQTIEVVRARDGLEIEGLLIKPVGYAAGQRYPFVIVAHGGPEAHFSDGWLTNYSNWGQLLAARGYVSWYPNYRSSTGYGTAFCKHDHGDPMGKEFDDHLDAIAHFAKEGLIDPKRVGIGGGSYGGYTAAWAATRHSEHFAAAVSFVPFVDIRTKWLTSDIPWEFYYVHYQERWPWQQPGLLADRSPLSWVERCRTPLLLLGGLNDTRVHHSQPFLLYRAVKFATDTPVRYIQYPGEGHGNRTNVYQLDYAMRSLQWFDHYLQPGDRRAEPPPPLDLDYPR